MGKKSKHGFYGPALVKFVNSEEVAINPREVWPNVLGDVDANSPNTIAQGFRNAAKAAKINIENGHEDQVLTITQVGNEVFIIHNERAQTWQTLQDSGLNDALDDLESESDADEVDEPSDDDEPIASNTSDEPVELTA